MPLFDPTPASTEARPAVDLWRRLRVATRAALQTLKVRVMLGALAALVAGVAITTLHMARVAEVNLLLSEQDREQEDAQRMAAVIGRRVAELQRALRVVGDQMDRSLLDDPGRLTRFLQDRPVLGNMFGSLSAIDTAGSVRLIVDAGGPRTPSLSVADREYFKRTLSTRLAVISEPIASRLNHQPLLIFAQPLTDENGVWGVLAGALNLESRDLIGDLSETMSVDDDRILVVTDDFGRILAHPRSGHILDVLPSEPRLSGVWAQWLAQGRPLLRDAGTWSSPQDVVAMAGEPVSGWRVWSARAKGKVLAPLHLARRDAVAVSALFAVGMGVLLLLFLGHQLRPLSRLEHRAATLLSGDDQQPWPEAQGEIGQLTRTLRHVWAERTQIESFNAEVLQKLSSVMAASPVGLAFSRHQRFELVSAECCRLFSCTEGDLLGKPMTTIFADPEDYPRVRRLAHDAFDEGGAYEGEWRLVAADGHAFWAHIRARPVAHGNPDAGSIWSLYDITEQVEARSELQHAALHDALTGILNRKGFEQAAAAVFRGQADGRPAALVLLDLDRFKAVNDLGGHAAGDAMLRAVATAMTAQVRATDVVARLGGDEFALLLPGCDAARALSVADKLRQAIEDIVLHWETHAFRIGASMGVAERTAEHETLAAWMQAADAACYEAKHAGRNAVVAAKAAPSLRLVAGAPVEARSC